MHDTAWMCKSKMVFKSKIIKLKTMNLQKMGYSVSAVKKNEMAINREKIDGISWWIASAFYSFIELNNFFNWNCNREFNWAYLTVAQNFCFANSTVFKHTIHSRY